MLTPRLSSCVLLAVLAAGCQTTPIATLHTGKTNVDEVWVGTIDAVSNYLHVDMTDPNKGLIEARSDGVWQRNLARIEIRPNGGQYDVCVGAFVESSKVVTRPSGLRAGEERHLMEVNADLRDTLVAEIKKRLNVQKGASPKAPKSERPQKQTPASEGSK